MPDGLLPMSDDDLARDLAYAARRERSTFTAPARRDPWDSDPRPAMVARRQAEYLQSTFPFHRSVGTGCGSSAGVRGNANPSARIRPSCNSACRFPYMSFHARDCADQAAATGCMA